MDRYERCHYFYPSNPGSSKEEPDGTSCGTCGGIDGACPLVNPALLWQGDEHAYHVMKNVHGVGPFYFVMHRDRPERLIMHAGMREIDPPYRWGSGIEVRLPFGRTLGLGTCRRKKFENDYVATREAIAAHDISKDDQSQASEIGDW